MAYVTMQPRGRNPSTPGRATGSSGIPTPGRSRASSSANAPTAIMPEDSPAMSRALSDAIRANDPKYHRATGAGNKPGEHTTNSFSAHSSPSPHSAGLPVPQTGQRSVPRLPNVNTTGRPSSAASSSTSTRAPLPKTPTSGTRAGGFAYTPRASTSRPESRQSDVVATHRKDRAFEPGDAVRIGSLGMEGTLRFVGSIEGKAGIWAGVELAPGFAGRGKNDGSVNGVSYFSCAPKCGVFVAVTNLSAPIARPPSVASSRGRTTPLIPPSSGRRTPSVSGRATPAYSGGHATPSHGRVTPSFTTPGQRPRPSVTSAGSTPAAKLHKPSFAQAAEAKITAGSRASRYLGMTAQQLQSAKNSEPSVSSTRTSGPLPSPFATPRPLGITGKTLAVGVPTPSGVKSRQSAGGLGLGPSTPRSGRKTEMLPPASPISPSKRLPVSSPSRVLTTPTSPSRRLTTPTGSEFSVGIDEREERNEQTTGSGSLETRNRELQDRIANLMNGKPVNGAVSPLLATAPDSRPTSVDPTHAAALEAAEKEVEKEKARVTAALARVSEVEAQVRFHERAVKERESRIESLERSLNGKEDEIEKVRGEGEARGKELMDKLKDSEALVTSLKLVVEEVRAGKKEETEAIIAAKDKEIELLESKVDRALSDLDGERKELGSQIEELRQAGQETIALYEEKLSEADAKRWEMEDHVHELEDKVRKQNRSLSPATVARHVSEAAQIDNETLKEQVLHFERKVNLLEGQLENARDVADKEEQAMRTRISKYKENDSALKKELTDARAEVENRKRLEAAAKTRVEEVEEALRENVVALENARAEIEGLRTDITNLEGLHTAVDRAKSDNEALKRSAADGPRQKEEILQLKEQLESTRSALREVTNAHKLAEQDADSAKQRADTLETAMHALEDDKLELERVSQDRSVKLTTERKTVATLKQDLDARVAELEQLRKSIHRDQPLTPSVQRKSSASSLSRGSRHERRNSGDEITGLKHIVQQLNKENLELNGRIKLVESDKFMLQEECDELREAMKTLESDVNEELKQLDYGAGGGESSGDVQKALREAKAKYELELGQLRQKALEAEQKHAQTVRDLNKEVSELESLVEAKIYREDDLERELERYKEKLTRATQRKHSKNSGESMLSLSSHATRVSSGKESAGKESEKTAETTPDDDVCEICEQPGHEFSSCPLLNDDLPSAGGSSRLSITKELWCDDCESYGHVAADCPHSMDVF